MKVRELIKKLLDCDLDDKVLVPRSEYEEFIESEEIEYISKNTIVIK